MKGAVSGLELRSLVAWRGAARERAWVSRANHGVEGVAVTPKADRILGCARRAV